MQDCLVHRIRQYAVFVDTDRVPCGERTGRCPDPIDFPEQSSRIGRLINAESMDGVVDENRLDMEGLRTDHAHILATE